jgi:hypothetical protein
VTGAGPPAGPALCSGEPDLVRQEFWAWLTGAQLVRKSGAAMTASTTAGRARPVTTDQISFTGMRREVNRSMVQTLVTATTSPAVLAALAEATGRAALGTLIVTGRQRHSGRRQKSRPRFPYTQVTTSTVTGPVTIIRFHPAWVSPQAPGIPDGPVTCTNDPETEASAPRGPWNRTRPQRDAGLCHAPSVPSPSASRPTRSKPRGKSITPQPARNT